MPNAQIRDLWPVGLALLFAGCDADDPSASGSICEQAAARLVECGIAEDADPGDDCDEARAESTVSASCDELEAAAAQGKSDGWWDDFLCGLGFVSHCPLPEPQPVPETGYWDRYDLPGSALHPEGGAFDPVDEVFYVGSLTDGRVLAVDAKTAGVTELSGPEPAGWASLGMAVDAERRRLWVCALHDVDPLSGEVWQFDLDTGDRLRHDLRDAADGGSCNDVAVAPDGIAYATDREQGNIYRVVADAERTELLVAHELLDPPSIGLGQNGIVVLPDGKGLITTSYLPPRLQHVTLTDSPEVHRIDISGDFHDFSHPGSGADGMVMHDGALLVIFNSELVRLTSDDDWRSAKARSSGTPRGGMTSLMFAGPDLYLLNGQAVQFVAGLDPNLPFSLLRWDGPLP